ncbi:MAG: hypothetical protein WC686_02825 [Candidatus Shapirobacteria bacterium]|jgi:hypothetical protein
MHTKDQQEYLDDFTKELATKHQAHVHIRLKIVHQENSSTETSEFLMQRTTNWNRLSRPPFFWDMDRPKTGAETFKSSCPYCQVQFEATIDSLDQLVKNLAEEKRDLLKTRILRGIISIISLILLITAFKTPGFNDDWTALLTVISFFALPLSFISLIQTIFKETNIGVRSNSFQSRHDTYASGTIHYKTVDSY